jgi:multiple sugar transport system ATP-binding protein
VAELRLEGVSKTYPSGLVAVRNVSLTVADGELVVLVGPSGCGKSTILRMISGLETVTEGRILLDGRPIDKITESARDIAMIFQNYALYPHLSVYNNIGFPLKLARMPRRERDARIREVAQTLGLTPYLDSKPGQLSGGQRQRVAMGRAIVRRPQAFLMDEPLSNLDAKLRAEMRTELSELQRRLATTMIYVTHDQAEAWRSGTGRPSSTTARCCRSARRTRSTPGPMTCSSPAALATRPSTPSPPGWWVARDRTRWCTATSGCSLISRNDAATGSSPGRSRT